MLTVSQYVVFPARIVLAGAWNVAIPFCRLTCRPNLCSDGSRPSNVVAVDRGSDPADEFDRLVPKLDLYAVEGVARAMASGREW